jgi:2-phosphoglycerate kinase
MNDNSIINSYLQFKQVRGKKRHHNFSRGISDLSITVIHVEVEFKFSLALLSRHDLIFEPRK